MEEAVIPVVDYFPDVLKPKEVPSKLLPFLPGNLNSNANGNGIGKALVLGVTS